MHQVHQMKVSTDDEFISKMAIFQIDPVLTHEPFWFLVKSVCHYTLSIVEAHMWSIWKLFHLRHQVKDWETQKHT